MASSAEHSWRERIRPADLDPERMVRRIGELVGIETPTGHTEGVRACFSLLRQWLTPVLGSAGTVFEQDGVPHLLWQADDPKVLLLCHVDTVWPLGTLERLPFTVHNGRGTGPGIFDMKTGLVLGVEALEITEHTGHVGFLVTSDEEQGSVTSRALIERVAADYDAVLLLEPSQHGAVKTARKGAGIYRVHLTGRAAHAGLEPEAGINALSELARLVPRIEGLADTGHRTTVTPTVAHAGTAVNAVAAQATLDVDVRGWTASELDRVDAEIRGLAPENAEIALEVRGGVNRYPLEPGHTGKLLELARSVAAELGLDPVEEAHVGGASDGNFTSALGIPTLDGLGALGDGAHAEHEWIDVPALPGRARLIAGMLAALRESVG
ncbi:M20/M25/M40 family metallo-hydrolase [Sciscionella sediminilitoris]|uniref:M20/M25/M40 family metallo-hydrolase n=1 Tax=Sciscionella sediminilitoris TaxID=1445613 RepID=UPI0009E81A3D|nr:M20/M25/M40 family metallo-hydrolase [Sciscionella sp. SE31]